METPWCSKLYAMKTAENALNQLSIEHIELVFNSRTHNGNLCQRLRSK